MRSVILLSFLCLTGCGRQAWLDAPAIELPSPAGPGSSLPHLAASPGDTLVLSWVEPVGDGGTALKFSVLEGDRWGAARVVAQGTDWFLNWADFPSVVPMDETHWAAHWLVKRAGGEYAYDIAISVSSDRGRSWSAPITPHRDGTATEHGFVSLFPADGAVAAAWLDGRETAASMHQSHDVAGDHGAMTLRSARIGFDGKLSEQRLIDERVCDCCQTAAVAARAGALLAYRDRDADEVRDISVGHLDTAGWRPLAGPQRDGWRIQGCPVNGPAIDAIDRHVALAWFTAADDITRVRVALSQDSGGTFGVPIEIARPALGRADVVALPGGGAVVSWMASTDDGAAIYLRRVDGQGPPGPVRTVSSTANARSAGFPQLERRGSDLVVAWTVTGEPSTIRTALLEAAAAP